MSPQQAFETGFIKRAKELRAKVPDKDKSKNTNSHNGLAYAAPAGLFGSW
jgi:hypothetical protein